MDNQWGVKGCRKRVDFVTAKLMREATKRAVQWRAVPFEEKGGLLNTTWNKVWKGAFLIPGVGITLEPFVRQMVETAIKRAEKDKKQEESHEEQK